MERSFVRIATKAGIEGCNFHSLRHTYATRLFELGVPVNVVSKLLDHAKTSLTTDIYISVMPSLKNDAVKALDLLHSRALDSKPILNHLTCFLMILGGSIHQKLVFQEGEHTLKIEMKKP